ncbi:MAG: GNAT family N-acetyltransferase [Woeseiaceae bacterium]|nr:GNAT family N-acetyltransferase [Woeseiaceae bacterium]
MNFTIRDVAAADLEDVLSLNEAVVPAVNSLSARQMQHFADIAAYFRVVVDADGVLAAFLIGLRPGTDYESPNYGWFCRHYEDFGYVDRVAVADHARRFGLASMLYADFRASLPDSVTVMTCEVNMKPPNHGSMRFHRRQGFRQVGTQATEGGAKEVALMEWRL